MHIRRLCTCLCKWLCTRLCTKYTRWGEVGRHYAAFARLTSEVSNHWAQWAQWAGIPVPDLPLNHISSPTFPPNLRRPASGLLKTADINEMQLLVLYSGKYKQQNLTLAWNIRYKIFTFTFDVPVGFLAFFIFPHFGFYLYSESW